MKILFGLGNPGAQYELTRHNVGFRLIDRLGTECNATFKVAKSLKAELAKISMYDDEIVLVKPITYMNSSGLAFLAVQQWYKQPLANCFVIHDDCSLELGCLRIQRNGGAGGQHGVESIIEVLGGNKAFDRLKFGVGPDPGGDRRADYVLSRFPEAQNEMLENSLQLASNAIKLWLEKGTQAAMNSFNGIHLGRLNSEK
jgi:PTH1 family peptidyl-tRNA hydrolase